MGRALYGSAFSYFFINILVVHCLRTWNDTDDLNSFEGFFNFRILAVGEPQINEKASRYFKHLLSFPVLL